MEEVSRSPGLRLLDVAAAAGAKRSTAKHHLGILEQVGLVKAVRKGDSTRYFPGTFLSDDAEDVALLLRGRMLEVAHVIAREPGVRQVEITRALNLSRKVFRTYANLLILRGLVLEEAGLNTLRYFPTSRLHRIVDEAAPVVRQTAARPAPSHGGKPYPTA